MSDPNAEPITLYHNPRCSKSRQTLALLQSRGITPTIVRYLETPPDTQTLATLLQQLGLSARQLLRRQEADYQRLGLDAESVSEPQLLAAMIRHPKLIERPIVVRGARACLGRPPENVLALLD